jgi:GT2 family glycosyltransferase
MSEGKKDSPLQEEGILISVVVPFRNAAHCLENCLEGLAAQTYKNAEFVLVDNNSEDAGAERVRQFAMDHPELILKLVSEEKKGASAARNRGVRKAAGAWIAFTDADCIPWSDWLATIALAIHENPEVGAFAGCIRPALPRNQVEKFLGLFTLPAYLVEEDYREYTLISGGFPTANFAVSKGLFEKVGGFDEGIPIYGEDHALCADIYQHGYAIRTLLRAQVLHQHRSSLKGLCRQSFGFGRSHALCLRRLVPGAVIWMAPLVEIVRIVEGWRIWIDLNQADKKMLLAVVLGFLWSPFWILTVLYFLYLCRSIHGKGNRSGAKIHWVETPLLAWLLLIKSAAMTAGRLVGSCRDRVFCL